MSFRMEQIDKLMRKEISIVMGQIKDKYLGFLTVVKVETSKDLSSAKVWLSSFEGKTEEEINSVIRHYMGDIYAHMKKRVPIKRIPHLFFKVDDTSDVLDTIEGVMKEEEAREEIE